MKIQIKMEHMKPGSEKDTKILGRIVVQMW